MVNNEQRILFLLKYSPPFFTLIAALFITLFIYFENQHEFNKTVVELKNEFFISNKLRVKQEVEKVYEYVTYQRELSQTKLKNELRQRVYNIHNQIKRIYKRNQKKSKKEILKKIKESVNDIRFFNGRGYFYIQKMNGENILHPLNKDLEGQNLSSLTDSNGNFIVKESIEILKTMSEGFYEWYWPKDKKSIKTYKKIGFQKVFKPLEIYIGTGEYLVDYEKELKEEVFSYLNRVKFSNNGFIFTIDYSGYMLSNPNITLQNKNVFNEKSSDNIFYVQDMISIAKNNKEGFIEYKPPSISDESIHLKTSFIKGFDYWNILIGAGFYHNDFDKEILREERVLKDKNSLYIQHMLIVSFVITFILLIISIYISKLIQKEFLKYKNIIKFEEERNRDKDRLLSQQTKMAAMGEMIGNIAHQWRQPLSSISTTASGVKLKIITKKIKDEEINHFMEKIIEYSQHLSDTIDDFKNFFTPHSKHTSFSINSVCEKTKKILHAQLKDNEINVISELNDITIFGLENELLQVIINIFNNSKDAFIHNHTKECYIFIETRTQKDKCIIEIKDNAGGIKKSIMNRIFEPYFTTKHQSQGTGIGLYMSQEIIVKHMNGQIDCENQTFYYNNKKYVGALLTITLPINEN